MNVEVKERKIGKGIKYPCLMVYPDGLLVLFCKESCGTVISRDDTYHIGEYDENWDMDKFEPFDGEVTLKND